MWDVNVGQTDHALKSTPALQRWSRRVCTPSSLAKAAATGKEKTLSIEKFLVSMSKLALIWCLSLRLVNLLWYHHTMVERWLLILYLLSNQPRQLQDLQRPDICATSCKKCIAGVNVFGNMSNSANSMHFFSMGRPMQQDASRKSHWAKEQCSFQIGRKGFPFCFFGLTLQ